MMTKSQHSSWKDEVEKKYKLQDAQQYATIRHCIEANRCRLLHEVLQRDWIPDFEDGRMKKQGVLLRIRHLTYTSGEGPSWYVTLKRQNVELGVHHNLEIEASQSQETELHNLARVLTKICNVEINVEQLASTRESYGMSLGLTRQRMLLEKKRREYISQDNSMLLALDELPTPLGYFLELEARVPNIKFKDWEKILGLEPNQTVSSDYGELVKEATGGRMLIF